MEQPFSVALATAEGAPLARDFRFGHLWCVSPLYAGCFLGLHRALWLLDGCERGIALAARPHWWQCFGTAFVACFTARLPLERLDFPSRPYDRLPTCSTSYLHWAKFSNYCFVNSSPSFLIFFYFILLMADSLLAKLGYHTFTAEEQDAIVVAPDSVAIPAEDFVSSLVGKVKYWFALEQANPNRTIHDYSFLHMCIWVRIHNIPLSLMTAALARVLGASIGKVIMTDTRLDDGNMGEFMRVHVLIDTSKPLRRCVVLSRPDAKASMCPLQYERLPLFCHGCGLISHPVLACPTTPKVEGQKFQYGAWLRAPLPKRSATRPRGRLSVVDDDLDVPVSVDSATEGPYARPAPWWRYEALLAAPWWPWAGLVAPPGWPWTASRRL
ncbi:hypothetical protein GQ457_11G026570 [Hibiscus cannabinus]